MNEAMRLMEQSKDSLLREESDGAGRRAESVVDRIYKVIREIASGDGRKSLKVSVVFLLQTTKIFIPKMLLLFR